MAKDFFGEHNIAFTDHNVSTDLEKRKEMIQRSGQMGVPVITIGNELVIGYDKKRISDLLGIAES